MELWLDIKSAGRIGISGHIRPDGDCVGSCIALYQYIQDNYNQTFDKTVDVFLECVPEAFHFLAGVHQVRNDYKDEMPYDLWIVLDSGDMDRLGKADEYFQKALKTYVIDHHITNKGFGKVNIINPLSSSTCELLYDLMEDDKLSFAAAEALYLGIVHDTGVFKHSNTTEHTMVVAGRLLSKGVRLSEIINGTFFEKTYLQNQLLGRCLMESILMMEGMVIVAWVSRKIQEFYGSKPSDMDGIIDQLRVTKGVEVAILLREDGPLEYKVSMRSNYIVDVGKIASFHSGGGHVRAAGCEMKGSLHDVINNLTLGIEQQLKAAATNDKRNEQLP